MVEDSEMGLYANNANSKFAASRMLDKPLKKTTDQEFSLEFKVLQEEGQVCGDAQISLFGNNDHLNEEQMQAR